MGLRAKSKKRLVVMTAAVAGVLVLGGSLYVGLRMHHAAQVRELKPRGLAAYKAGEWVPALRMLAPYVLQYPDDLEALEVYGDVRQKLPEPDGTHISEAAGIYRRIVAMKPNNLEDKQTLMKLCSQGDAQGARNTETRQAADNVIKQLAGEILKSEPKPATDNFDGMMKAVISELKRRAQQPADGQDISKKYIEPMAEALQLKAAALIRLRKMDEARAAAEQAVAIDPLSFESGEALLAVMKINADRKEDILNRFIDKPDALTAGRDKDTRAMLLRAEAYSIANELEKAKVTVVAAAETEPKDEKTVLKLSEMLDRVDEYGKANEVVEKGIAKFHGESLEDEHFRRMIYREEFQRVTDELGKTDVTKRPLLAGLHVIALCEMAKQLDAAGKKTDAAAEREGVKPLMQVLDDCGNKWDFRANGWRDVLQLAYLTDKPRPRDVIEACREALSRDRQNAYFFLLLGNGYADSGDATAAVIQWNNASKVAPSWSRPLTLATNYFIGIQDFTQAQKLAEGADRRLPNQKETMVAIARSRRGAVANETDAKKLLAYIKDPANQQVFAFDENVLPLEVGLLVSLNQKPAAEERVKAVVNAVSTDNAGCLLPLAVISQQAELDSTCVDACFAKYKQLKGTTSELAVSECRVLLTKGAQDQARNTADKEIFPKAGAKTKELLGAMRKEAELKPDADVEGWGLAWCQLLEAINDPGAAAAWKALADGKPDSNRVQWAALRTPSLRTDHAARGQMLERLKSLDGDSGLTWRLEKGQWLLQDTAVAGAIDQALKLLKETVAMSPDSGEARQLLGVAFDAAGRPSDAVIELNRAVELQSQNTQAKMLLARLYLKQNDAVRANNQLRAVISSPRASEDEKLQAGLMLANNGDVEGSRDTLKKNEDRDPAIKLAVAKEMWQQGDWQGAEMRFNELLDKSTPELVEQALQFYGAMQDSWAKTDAEKQDLQKMKQAGISKAQAKLDGLQAPESLKHGIWGAYLVQQNQPDQAIMEFATAVKLEPTNGVIWRRLIATQLSVGKIDDAVKGAADAKQALGDDPTINALVAIGGGEKSPLNNPILRQYFASSLLIGGPNTGIAEVMTTLRNAPTLTVREFASRLRMAAQPNRENFPLQIVAIRMLMVAGSLDDAMSLAQRTMGDNPSAPMPAYLAASCAVQLGRWDDAATDINRWKASAGGSTALEGDLILAMSQLGSKHFAEAGAILEKQDKVTKPDHPAYRDLVYLLALSEVSQQQYDKAEKRLWPEVEKEKSWRADWCRLAVDNIAVLDPVTHQIGNVSVAKRWLAKLSEVVPQDDIEGQMILGLSWFRLGSNVSDAVSKQEGYRLMRAAVSSKGGDPKIKASVASMLAQVCESEGDLARAEDNYRDALKNIPDYIPAANNLAVILARNGEGHLAEAEQLARKAADSKPKAATYYDTLAFVLRKAKKFDDAVAAIDEAIKLDDRNPEWLISKAEIFIDRGSLDKARDSLGKVDALPSQFKSAMPPALKVRFDTAKQSAFGSKTTL